MIIPICSSIISSFDGLSIKNQTNLPLHTAQKLEKVLNSVFSIFYKLFVLFKLKDKYLRPFYQTNFLHNISETKNFRPYVY